MKTLLVFLMLHNYADGQQDVIYTSAPMSEQDCIAMQSAAWKMPSPVVGTDEDGQEIEELDAACVAPQTAGQLSGGWKDLTK